MATPARRTRQHGRRWQAAVLGGLLLVAAACGGDDDTSAPGTTASTTSTGATGERTCPRDPAGTRLTMGTVFEVAGLDPTVAFGSGQSGQSELHAIYDALMRYVPETRTYEPHVAASLTPNDDRTEWTLVLRDGIRFGNGDPLTAEAVRYSLERLGRTTRFAAGQVQEIASMEVVDDLTLRLTMRRPNGQLAYTLSGEAGMVVNPRLAEERGEGLATDPNGAGVGPFEVERFAPGEELVLRAKDDYWGGPVCLETLRFVRVGASQASWEAFQAGELDVAFLEDDPRVIAEARADGKEVYASVAAGGSMLNLNNREGRPTADPRVRRAIAHAIDVDLLARRLFGDAGVGGTTVTSPEQPAWGGVEGIRADADTARRLVAEAKADGWDGRLGMVFSNTPFETDLSIALEGMLEAVGMDVERENLPPNAALERLLQPPYDYDVARAQLAVLDTGGFARLNQFLSDSVRNRTGYGSPDMDAAILELLAASDVEEEAAAYGRIQEIWNRDVPSVPLLTTSWSIIAQDHVGGLAFTTEAAILWHGAYVD